MNRLRVPQTTLGGLVFTLVIGSLSLTASAQIPNIPQNVRKSIELTLGAKGIYIPSEGAFKVRMVRKDIQQTAVQHGFPGMLPESWAAFGPAFHQQAIVTAEFSLLGDEITPVIGAALDSGLQITGLANSTSDGPHVFTLDTWELGDYDHLASGVRRCLDAISVVRRNGRGQSDRRLKRPAEANGIDAGPIDTILSMKGTVTDGVYRAAIGRVTLLNGTPIGRELGASTWIVMSGTNQRAIVEGEFVATQTELQSVLRALRTKRLEFVSIRNHTVGEHPQLIFIRFKGEGSAVSLAQAIRYALNVQFGLVGPSV